MSTYAFIGLGTMGYPMAGHLAQSGHAVHVFNRTHSTSEQWLEDYSPKADGVLSIHTNASAAAHDADIIMLCLGNDEHVREQVTHPEYGILHTAKAGTIIIDHTTTSATLAENMAKQCALHGVHFVDAPVSGGQQGAQNGNLVAMVGCEHALWLKVQDALSSYTSRVTRIGDVGSGQKAKMVNQICVAGVLQGLAEALHLSETLELDTKAVLDTIKGGAAGSWQMSHRGESMLQGHYEHGFAIDWMIKDLGICLKQAEQCGINLPATEMIKAHYDELHDMGAGHFDTSALLHRLQKITH